MSIQVRIQVAIQVTIQVRVQVTIQVTPHTMPALLFLSSPYLTCLLHLLLNIFVKYLFLHLYPFYIARLLKVV